MSPRAEFQAVPSCSGRFPRASPTRTPRALPIAFSQPLTSTSPSPASLEFSPSLSLLYPVLPNPSLSPSSPEIADILHSGIRSLSPFFVPYLPPVSPRTSLMRVEGLLGSSFACPWSRVPRASHLCLCNSPPVCYRLTYTHHQRR